MNTCRNIRPWLEWLAAGEIEGDRKGCRWKRTLRECPACRQRVGRLAIVAGGVRPAGPPTTAAQMQAIDWEKVTAKVMAGIAAKSDARPRKKRRCFHWRSRLSPPFCPGCWYGNIFLDPRPRRVPSPGRRQRMSAATVTRLQSGLAREEVLSYLQQSQLMFTDLLKDCASEEVAPWEIRLYSRQAKELLLKKKYFQQNLPAVEWLKVRNVSERIDWLNYEILQLEERQLCSQINRLQRIMENEKLLLKIRLLERDLSLPALSRGLNEKENFSG